MSRRRRKTVEEVLADYEADPQWRAEQEEYEREVDQRVAKLRAEERPIVQELRAAGFKVKSVEGFYDRLTGRINTPQGALSILLKHLDRAYSSELRHELAMGFATATARPYWNDIKRRFVEESDDHVKQGFGNAVYKIALADKSLLPEVIGLMKNRRIGHVRSFLVEVLTRFSRDSRAQQALHDLKDDPDLKGEIGRYFHQRELRNRSKARKGASKR